MEAAGLTKNDEGVYVAGAFMQDVEAAPAPAADAAAAAWSRPTTTDPHRAAATTRSGTE